MSLLGNGSTYYQLSLGLECPQFEKAHSVIIQGQQLFSGAFLKNSFQFISNFYLNVLNSEQYFLDFSFTNTYSANWMFTFPDQVGLQIINFLLRILALFWFLLAFALFLFSLHRVVFRRQTKLLAPLFIYSAVIALSGMLIMKHFYEATLIFTLVLLANFLVLSDFFTTPKNRLTLKSQPGGCS